ncbi:MAG: SurA N-terminal domain-containing protein [Lachnospiraceae bacterium]|nr:SurA N-terminal domain-containing protein [Lachnospiraceae bacterium]
MAVLETIRVKLGILITVLIAVALLSFIIDPSTLQSVASSSSKYDVGEINGNSISYTDFQADVDRFTAINEVITGSSSMDEEQQQAIRDAAWQSLLDQHLFVRNAEKAGLHVGDEEMVALISGDMTSPVMAQNAVFFDENGNFSKDMVLEFVNYINTDQTGRLKLYWDYIQNTAKTQQYYDKYMSLFTQSDFTNPLMLTEEIAENNNTFDVEFVMVPIGIVQDTTITVSDSEIKKYYESHKKFYKQQASRDIEYVVFEVVPSAEDIAAANKDLVDVYDEFGTTDNMKAFLMSNSDRQYDAHWYKEGELNTVSAEVNDFVFGKNSKGVSEVFQNGNTFRAVRVLESANVPDSVYVKYVPEASENVDSLLNTVEPMWITEVPGYEDVMTAKKNSKVTTGGIVFQVLDRTAPVAKKRIAILEKEAVASKETVNGYYSQANTFATKAAGKYENFQNALTEEGVYAHPLYRMLESSDMLGSIDNTKEVTRWAFESKVGDVSNIITIDNNYFIVAALTGIHKEGYADVKDFAASISSYLASEKEAAKMVAEVSEKIAGLTDLEAIAEVLGTNVSTQTGVAFSSLTSQGLDPKFIGAASVAEEGKICGPIAGGIGVYVFKVTGRDTGAFYTEDDAKVRDAQMAQIYTQTILSTMMEEADVKDNRARFY